MKKAVFMLLMPLFFLFSPLFSLEKQITVKDKLIQGKEGDYIVARIRNVYTLIFLRQVTPATLLLEEISVPENDIEKGKMNWPEWVSNFAPGHVSWSAFEIDLANNTLKEHFSYTESAWIEFENEGYIFSHFLSLPLKRTPLDQRHRIGPPPLFGEFDNRSFWSPPLFFEGKKKEKPSFDILKTEWPKDSLLISECELEFYFEASPFPFPYWLEIKGTHYTFKMPIVDSGRGIISPQGKIPLRPPQFVGGIQRKEGKIQFTLKSPPYYKKFTLYAADASGPLSFALPVPFQQSRGEGKDLVVIEVQEKDLQTILKPGHRYRWMVIPEDFGSSYVEAEELFHWNPAS